MMVSNFSTESYDGKQLQYWIFMMVSNISTETYDDK